MLGLERRFRNFCTVWNVRKKVRIEMGEGVCGRKEEEVEDRNPPTIRDFINMIKKQKVTGNPHTDRGNVNIDKERK